jgi:hypothetical protein
MVVKHPASGNKPDVIPKLLPGDYPEWIVMGGEMPSDEWVETFEDGTNVKFIYHERPEGGVSITAQIEGSRVVHSVVLPNTRSPLTRGEVESHFESDLQKN